MRNNWILGGENKYYTLIVGLFVYVFNDILTPYGLFNAIN